MRNNKETSGVFPRTRQRDRDPLVGSLSRRDDDDRRKIRTGRPFSRKEEREILRNKGTGDPRRDADILKDEWRIATGQRPR